MRGTFAKTLAELADTDRRILLLSGDLGFMALEPFAERFPDRFFNVGVAEQNMVGLATGLAEAGFLPFIYSIIPFAVLRPYEFIRNGPVRHHLPVRIVGVGAGFDYGHNGATHYGLEDIGVTRAQPGLTVISPADAAQARTALCATWDQPGPVYYRLGKDDRTVVPGLHGRFHPGRIEMLREGSDLGILVTGSLATEAVIAAEALEAELVSCSLGVVSTLNPTPVAAVRAFAARFPLVVTLEAHYLTGGLGSLVAEVVADAGLGCQVMRCGVRSGPTGASGSQAYLQRVHGLMGDQVAARVLGELLERRTLPMEAGKADREGEHVEST